jgi:hypothetical protein
MKVYRYLSIASQTKAHLTGLTILTINLQQKYLRSIHPNAFPLGRIQRESVVWDWPVADVKTQVSGAAMVRPSSQFLFHHFSVQFFASIIE